jgi:hypothetical protein
VKNGRKGTGTTLGDKTKTMNVVIKDLNETKIEYERKNAILQQQLRLSKKDNNDDKVALQRSALKMLNEFNRKENISTNLKRKNNIEDDEDNESSTNKVNADFNQKKKKKSKINEILEEDDDDASVAYSNFTNESEYSKREDLDDDGAEVEVATGEKPKTLNKNYRTSPRKPNSKPDSNNDKKNDVKKGNKTITKNKGSNGKYLISFINIVDIITHI